MDGFDDDEICFFGSFVWKLKDSVAATHPDAQNQPNSTQLERSVTG